MQWTEAEAQRVLSEVIGRAKRDVKFRQLVLTNPNAAVGQVSAMPLPPGYKIRFVENQGANLTVVLPDPAGSDELSDAQLESVSGGADTRNQCGESCTGSCVLSTVL